MKRKLKTWKDFKEEFKPFADKWNEGVHAFIDYNNIHWAINKEMKSSFGTEIDIERILDGDPNYTYMGYIKDISRLWLWHELWFEPEFKPIEFLKEEDMEIL